jgi:citrate lyase subunit beta / citryl-CoA lyase
MTPRPRRSVLFMPASNHRALEKGRTLPADGLIFDLEDAVAPEAKAEARAGLAAALAAGGYGGRELGVRVNAAGTPGWAEDLAAAARLPIHAVVLPKVETPEVVHETVAALEAAGAPEGLALWVMIETPRGIGAVARIATAHRRLACLALGTSDLAKELRLPPDPQRTGLLHALSACVLGARMGGLDVLDGVHPQFDDDAGLRTLCHQGRRLGFDGKTLIHPRQIAPANEIFSPTPEELTAAEKTLAAWAAARAQGAGVAVVDGRLIESLHVEEARRTVALAEAIAGIGS